MPTVIEIAPKAHLVLTGTPRHPLARFHNGQPRGQMRNFYFNGYFHLGLYGRQNVRVIYRPTEISSTGEAEVPAGEHYPFHMNLRYSKPGPRS